MFYICIRVEGKNRVRSVDAPDFDESPVVAFERAAARFSSRVALGSDIWEASYRELNGIANRLAHRLIASGVASGDRVVILMSHNAPLVAAVLGILKSGAIVAALDPDDPVSRLKALVDDAEPRVILADAQNQNLAAKFRHPHCIILNFESETATGPVHIPSIEIPPGQTAFLTYTSGTTGRPKGVMKSHRQLRRAAAIHSEAMQYTENDRIPLFATVSTGWGTTGLWCLLNGAMLYPYPLRTNGITGVADWIIDRGLTVYVSSVSVFRSLLQTIDERRVFSNVRAVGLGGETATSHDFRSFRMHFPRASIFVHTLSSSETSNIAWARWTQHDSVPEGYLSVGRFSRGMDVSLLGDDGKPVADGKIGEIVVKSRYLANGYWRDPQLTAERFSADLDGNGTHLFRTGDEGRINTDGLLEFCGRKDDRIKIRGNRIELMEIERAIERIPGVDRAAAVAAPRENHEPLLVAFVVKTRNAPLTARSLRNALRANLPLHMVPSRIMFLDSLPYNKANKIDKETLYQYLLPVGSDGKGNEPRTKTEVLLADIWAEILELPHISNISREDDFFNLGGDSLSGAVVAARIHAVLGIDLSLGAIADHPTVSSLAAFIDESQPMGGIKSSPIVRVPRAATMPASLFQEAIWNYRSSQTNVHSYRIIGPLNLAILRQCLSYLLDRHEILRTTFSYIGGFPVQIIHKSAPPDLSFIDLTNCEYPEDQADTIIREESSRELDFKKLPIRRNVLIKIAHNNYRLVRVSNLLITDGFASQILDAELATLYEAILHRKDMPFAKEPSLQYADYAVWQRQVMRPDVPYFNGAVNWWRNILSTKPKANPLPFRRLIRRAPLNPSEGVLQWKLEERVANRLDEIARNAGATHFTIRLAAFAALIVDVTASSTIVIGAAFANRNTVETQNIVGPMLNMVHLVFSYEAHKTFLEWLEFVRDGIFEATTRSELPHDRLRTLGVKPPEIEIYFTMSSDHPDQHFGNLVISNEFCDVGTMPQKCMFLVDERKPENCRVEFDANIYPRSEMRLMLDRYLRLLEAAAREPELPIGKLLMTAGAKPLRWTCANYAAPFYDSITAFYASSPLMKIFWKAIKRWLGLSGG
jgi:amino acid adenylation domain-containing protein